MIFFIVVESGFGTASRENATTGSFLNLNHFDADPNHLVALKILNVGITGL